MTNNSRILLLITVLMCNAIWYITMRWNSNTYPSGGEVLLNLIRKIIKFGKPAIDEGPHEDQVVEVEEEL